MKLFSHLKSLPLSCLALMSYLGAETIFDQAHTWQNQTIENGQSQDIQATQSIDVENVSVENGADVLLKSPSIKFGPSFTIKKGGTFTVKAATPVLDIARNQTANMGQAFFPNPVVTGATVSNILWSAVQAENVLFDNVAILNPEIMFLQAGSYTLSVSLDLDGEPTQFAVFVEVIDTGATSITTSGTTILGDNFDLTVSSSLTNITAVAWSKYSGPGDVVFGSPNNLNSNASFSTTGFYILQLDITHDGGVNNYFVEADIRQQLSTLAFSFDNYQNLELQLTAQPFNDPVETWYIREEHSVESQGESIVSLEPTQNQTWIPQVPSGFQFSSWETPLQSGLANLTETQVESIADPDLKLWIRAHYEVIPPPEGVEPPFLSVIPKTSSPRPYWFWFNTGALGVYRFKLNDDRVYTEAEISTDHFQPVAPLSEGIHTLYIQEKYPDGSWSEVISMSCEIDFAQANPNRELGAPDFGVIAQMLDYDTYTTQDLETHSAQVKTISETLFFPNQAENFIDHIYAVALDLDNINTSDLFYQNLFDMLHNMLEENDQLEFPVLSELVIQKLLVITSELNDRIGDDENLQVKVFELLNDISKTAKRIQYAYHSNEVLDAAQNLILDIQTQWATQFKNGDVRSYEFADEDFALALRDSEDQTPTTTHSYTNSLYSYRFPEGQFAQSSYVFSALVPFMPVDDNISETAPHYFYSKIILESDLSTQSLSGLSEPIQLNIQNHYGDHQLVTPYFYNNDTLVSSNDVDSSLANASQAQFLLSAMDVLSYVSKRSAALEAPNELGSVTVDFDTQHQIQFPLQFRNGFNSNDYTLSLSYDNHLSAGTVQATLNQLDATLTIDTVQGTEGRVYFHVLSEHSSDTQAEKEYTLSLDIRGNSQPTTGDITLTVTEDTNYEFDVLDLAIADADGIPTIDEVIFLSVPSQGELQYDDGMSLLALEANTWYPISLLNNMVFIPQENAFGNSVYQFNYQVQDEHNSTSVAGEITIDITSVNDLPLVVADTYNLNEGQTFARNAAQGVLANDSDVETANLTAETTSDVSNGDLTFNADGSFTYTPDEYFNGTDSFMYRAYDSTDYSNPVIVDLVVANVPNAPVASNDSYEADLTYGITISVAQGVLQNDFDGDNDSLTAELVDDVIYGTLTLNADGSFDYVHTENRVGLDNFTYRVFDGTQYSNTASVQLDVKDLLSTFSGTVTGGDVEGVRVTLVGENGTQTTTTDVNGDYTFNNVLLGTNYTLSLGRVYTNLTPASESFTFSGGESFSHTATYDADNDVDNDGILDRDEIENYETDPYTTTSDVDGDGIPDTYDPAPNVAAIGLPAIITLHSPAANDTFTTPSVQANFTVAKGDSHNDIDEVRFNSEWVSNTEGTFTPTATFDEGDQLLVIRVRTDEGHLSVVKVPLTINELPPVVEFVSHIDSEVVSEQNQLVKIWTDSPNGTVQVDSTSASRQGYYYTKWVYLGSEGSNSVSTSVDDSTNITNENIDLVLVLDPNLPSTQDFDGDGVQNYLDLFPYDPYESTDNDADGVGSNTDPDDNDANIRNAIQVTSHEDGQVLKAK